MAPVPHCFLPSTVRLLSSNMMDKWWRAAGDYKAPLLGLWPEETQQEQEDSWFPGIIFADITTTSFSERRKYWKTSETGCRAWHCHVPQLPAHFRWVIISAGYELEKNMNVDGSTARVNGGRAVSIKHNTSRRFWSNTPQTLFWSIHFKLMLNYWP